IKCIGCLELRARSIGKSVLKDRGDSLYRRDYMLDISDYRWTGGHDFQLGKLDPGDTADFKEKKYAEDHLESNIRKMIDLQARLYAVNSYAILAIFQAMDTAGKDGAISHVMSGLNPQATQVHSFKEPSMEELNHDYLWR